MRPPPPYHGTHRAVPARRPPVSIPIYPPEVHHGPSRLLPVRLLPSRLLAAALLLFGLLAALVPSAVAAAPTVTTSPALVPFSETPGQPGVTTLTCNAGGTAGRTACGQDNAQPPFVLGPVDANTPLALDFPFIQAGTYSFWLGADATCKGGTKLGTATAVRLGPTGKAGVDAVQFRLVGQKNLFTVDPPGGTLDRSTALDISLLGLIPSQTSPELQTFPIPGVQLCIMSGDGAQVSIAMQVGQDTRVDKGLGASAATTTVTPIAGQNGCFAIPWVVNGGYKATIARSGASYSLGFCVITSLAANRPSVTPTASGIGRCAQVADFPFAGAVAAGTEVNGSIVTGADNHAVQVCVSAFTPNPIGVPDVALANTVNAYNQSGALNLTPLALNFPVRTKVKVETFDITGPGPGGQGGAQFTCPKATGTQAGPGGDVTAINTTAPAGTMSIDAKLYTIQ
jgi:hypothetical protein